MGVLVINLLTYKALIAASYVGVNRNMEENAAATAGDLKDYVEQSCSYLRVPVCSCTQTDWWRLLTRTRICSEWTGSLPN